MELAPNLHNEIVYLCSLRLFPRDLNNLFGFLRGCNCLRRALFLCLDRPTPYNLVIVFFNKNN